MRMIQRGTVVLTPFPFTDLQGQKIRPAVVVSPTGRGGGDVIVAFISSVYDERRLRRTDLLLKRTDKDFSLTGLKRDSVFRMDKIATLDKRILLGELGRLSKRLEKMADIRLWRALGIQPVVSKG